MGENNSLIPKIANTIGVNKSTVYRELKRNKHGKPKACYPEPTQEKYEKRMHEKPKFKHLTEEIRMLICSKLSPDWSPEQIAGFCKANGKDCVSHETIY
jgi:IS30 family transposase